MGERTNIGWTDHTWNSWHGCAVVSPACDSCYAWVGSKRNPAVLGRWGTFKEGGTRILASPKSFLAPLEWNAKAKAEGVRRRVFLASIADVFEAWDGPLLNAAGNPMALDLDLADSADPRKRFYPFRPIEPVVLKKPATMRQVREVVFRIISKCKNLDFLLLTKRIELVKRELDALSDPTTNLPFFGHDYLAEEGWRHVKIGCTVEDQKRADERLYHLISIPASVRWVSYEPALGPVDFTRVQYDGAVEFNALNGDHGVYRPLAGRSNAKVSWVIVGGESGAKSGENAARPFNVEWARDVIRQCREHGTSVFMKQMGTNPVDLGRPIVLEHRKGEDPSEWADGLNVRQFYES